MGEITERGGDGSWSTRAGGSGRARVGPTGPRPGAARATSTAWAPVRGAERAEPGRGSGRAQVPGARVYGTPRTPQRGPGGPDWPGGPGGPGGHDGPGRSYRGRRRNWRRIVLLSGILVLVLAMLGVGGVYMYARGLDKDLARTDPFSQITAGRPAKTVDGALNILLVGSDSRDPDAPIGQDSNARADTTILMHIPASHDQAYLVSIPRDLWVPVPQSPNAECGDRRAKINAAFAFGGLPLAVRTVECFTDVRIDHVMAIDFGGFKEVTDALGGVDLYVERTITSIHKPFRKFTKGTHHMTGAEALDYIRQRKQFPDGDFARMRHQQEFLKALMDKAASTGTLTNPGKLNSFLKAVTKAVTVDQDFSLVDMGLQFRNLRGNNLTFLTSPNKGSETIDGQSVVVSDREKAIGLYEAMVADKMADWVTANPSSSTGTGG